MSISEQALTNDGERMIVGNMWGYWAHLSIYCFALQFGAGRRVLDAGSGSGYGAAYLARHGAQVLALDASAVAIEHSRIRYAGDPVTFEVADLNLPLPCGADLFDLVFSSNVFEHVAHVDRLASECARVMRPDGACVVAVPPVINATAMAADLENRFHVHHIPPSAWEAKLKRFFLDVKVHRHEHAGAFATPGKPETEIQLPMDQVTIRETDFAFPEITAAEMEATSSLTAIFVCRGRRLPAAPETLAERTPAEWCELAVAANLIGRAAAVPEDPVDHASQVTSAVAEAELKAKLKAELRAEARLNDVKGEMAVALAHMAAREEDMQRRVAAMEQSTSWRMTSPLRSLRTALRGR
ncbi:class I SAM-dependent methyltransferase [Plastoroseomonas arctica]|uniref:Class I SAM-dependent methyltransferase n=1 Tax=Plastoroseomonas arctica TaxID=1509237 RepID=A0AAF1KKL4_9PROT|nr:class I SAM-dependent methyltransferase [Plastoroseomonas arctica]MBR0656685.1 class I SAM-dependent methyltransferase [Plastoroseomonas arctica]